VGTLSGGNLIMEIGSAYSWELADGAGEAGTGWDLVDLSGLLTLAHPVMTPINGSSTWST